MKLPYADDLNYWKTGQRSADVWLDMAKAEIKAAGGSVTGSAFGDSGGRAACTMLYHDVKAKAISARVHGFRAAYFQYLMLGDGRTAAEVATPDISDLMPKLLTGGN